MPRGTKIRIAVLLACAGVTIYEIPNVRLIWRYADMGRRTGRPGDVPIAEQTVPDEVAATDPEAAAVLRYCLNEPNDTRLAQWVERYHRNEFFLAQLAQRLTDASCVDPRAALSLADKLVALSPENAHYRYLKGWILLSQRWSPSRQEDAVEQFELGNRLPQFYLPHSQYADRVDRLCERASFGLLTRSHARPKETGFYFEMASFVGRLDGPYAALDPHVTGDLIDAAAQAAVRLLERARSFEQFESGRFLLNAAERFRLEHFELSESRAEETRFRIARTIALNDVLQEWYMEAFAFGVDIIKAGLPGLMLLLLLPVLSAVWLFLIIVNLLRGRARDAHVGIKSYIPFVTGLAAFWAVLGGISILNQRLPAPSLGAFGAVLLAVVGWIVLRVLARTRPVEPSRFRTARRRAAVVCGLLWAGGTAALILTYAKTEIIPEVDSAIELGIILAGWALVCAVLWIVPAYRHRLVRSAPDGWSRPNRAVRLLVVLLFMAGATCLLDVIPVAPSVCTFVAVLAVGIIVTYNGEDGRIVSHGLRHFFANRGPVVASRTRMVRLVSGTLLLCWVVVLVSLHLSAKKWKRVETWLNDPVLLYGPFSEATRETYENAILASTPVGLPHPYNPDPGIPEHMALAAPEDLSAFLAKRRREGKPVTDRRLLMFLYECGRDACPVILSAMKDPDALDVLLVRAKWGDPRVKERLEGIFEEKFDELGEPYKQLREDPNGLAKLILRAWWGDQEIKSELESIFEKRLARLTEKVGRTENRDRLRSELEALLAVDNALLYLNESANLALLTRASHDRYSRLQRLLVYVDMPDLEPSLVPEDVSSDLLGSLVRIAGGLAFVNEPQEAGARFRWLMPALISDWRRGDGSDRFSPRSFYLALAGLRPDRAASLLREYTKQQELSHPYEEREFIDVLGRVGGRELAEWVFENVVHSPPSRHAYRNVPIGCPVRLHDLRPRAYEKDVTQEYLEAIFPHLGTRSVPLLLGHLGSDNDQLRAFVVWRLTSHGYGWSGEQLRTLQQDGYWKVRLNALFADDTETLQAALADRNSVVQAVARVLLASGLGADRQRRQ